MLKIVNCTEYLKNKLYKIYKKTVAFTLAETLIVMGVIGVVAALTLPNLNQSTGNKEKVVKVKKIYQNLNDAFGRATAVYGPVDEWCPNCTLSDTKNKIGERLTEFIKLSKNCKMTKGCFNSGSGTSDGYEFITADGTAIQIRGGYIEIDIDGLNKGRNLQGIDIFSFRYDESGIYLNPMTESLFKACLGGRITEACTIWVINYDNMDYLKATSSGKCPNGTVLTYETVTSCN